MASDPPSARKWFAWAEISVLEILIVVVAVGVIASVSLPSLLRSDVGFSVKMPSCADTSASGQFVSVRVRGSHAVRVNDDLQVPVTVSSKGFRNVDMCGIDLSLGMSDIKFEPLVVKSVPLDNTSRVVVFRGAWDKPSRKLATLTAGMRDEVMFSKQIEINVGAETLYGLTDGQWKVVQIVGGFIGIPAILVGFIAWIRSRRKPPTPSPYEKPQ
jgi:hypothetical protein